MKEPYRTQMLRLFQSLNMQCAEPNSKMTILCSRAKDFDPEEDRKIWEDPRNQSSISDCYCCRTCNSPLAISHYLLDKLVESELFASQLTCPECWFNESEKENETQS